MDRGDDPGLSKIELDERNKEFFLKITDEIGNHKAVLQYDWLSKDHVDLYHTEVPPVFRGKGVGKKLAKEAVDHFVEKKIKMTPTCTFIQKYVKENYRPEFAELIVEAGK